jgi:peptidoglycan/LPS O-acetylase OafA/YrhL
MVSQAPADRLGFIDALRGFAALYVMLFHLVLVPSPNLLCPPWLQLFIMNGYTGVTLFFVVSAFTLCYTMEARAGEPRRNAAFYLRRICRIVPLYYVWLIAMGFIQWRGGLIHHKGEMLLFGAFGYNFLPGFQEGLVWASWTLGVEMVFYLVFPLVFWIVNSLSKALGFLSLTLLVSWVQFLHIQSLVAPGMDKAKFLKFSFFQRLPVFAVGILTYFIYRKRWGKSNPALSCGLLITGVAGICLLPCVPNRFVPVPMIYLMAPIYAAVLLGLSAMPASLLVNKATVFFGVISYSLYLNHPQLIYRTQKVYEWVYSTNLTPLVQLGICLGLLLSMVTAISCLTYMLIEKPGQRLGSRLIKYLRSGSRNPGAAERFSQLGRTIP